MITKKDRNWFVGDPLAPKRAFANDRWISEQIEPNGLEDIYRLMMSTNFYDDNYGMDWCPEPYNSIIKFFE